MAAELLLASVTDPSDRKAQAGLLADMAALNVRANRTSDAAACYRELLRLSGDVPFRGGVAPAAWLAALPGGDALRKEIHRPLDDWPKGAVETSGGGPTGGPYYYGNRGLHNDMVFGGPAEPYFTEHTVTFINNQEIGFRDGCGRTSQPRPIRLAENNRGQAFGFFNSGGAVARSVGHLLFVYVGTKIYALDPWHASGNSNPVLWTQDMTDAASDNGQAGQVFMGGVVAVNGMLINGSNGQRVNPFGPVNARMVCFQRMRNLVAVDPLSGEQLWVRQDVPQNSDVFGDDEYVFVVSPGKEETAVYRAADGEFLGERRLPHGEPVENINVYYNGYDSYDRTSTLAASGSMFIGRNVLTWRRGPDGKRVLAFFDPWRQRTLWPERTFAGASRVDVVQQNAVGVLEPSGHFLLLDLADGRAIADVQLKVRSAMTVTDLAVLRMGDQFIVLAQDRAAANNNNNNNEIVRTPQGMLGCSARRARVYALDLQGKLAWPEPVDVDHATFLLSQPARLPVLVFCSFVSDRFNNGNRVRTALVAVDRRDGRIVYEKNDAGPASPMGWMTLDIEGDPQDSTVRIRSSTENIVLKFTDKPVGKPVRRASGAKKGDNSLGGALLDAAKRAAGLPE